MTFKEYIKKFKLSNNSIVTLQLYEEITDLYGIEEFTELETLHFPNNAIKDIEPLKHLPNLNLVMLSYNLIEDLEALYYLPKLKCLWINGNPITNNNRLYSKFNNSSGVSGDHLIDFKNLIKSERRKRLINLLSL